MHNLQRLAGHRLVKFALVGAICGVFQIWMLSMMVEAFNIQGTFGKTAANTVAFFVSVQVNFVCSSLYTWRDRMADNKAGIFRKFIGFNTMMVTSLVANQVVFAMIVNFVPVVISGIIGIVAGAVINLLISNKFIFPNLTTQGAVNHA